MALPQLSSAILRLCLWWSHKIYLLHLLVRWYLLYCWPIWNSNFPSRHRTAPARDLLSAHRKTWIAWRIRPTSWRLPSSFVLVTSTIFHPQIISFLFLHDCLPTCRSWSRSPMNSRRIAQKPLLLCPVWLLLALRRWTCGASVCACVAWPGAWTGRWWLWVWTWCLYLVLTVRVPPSSWRLCGSLPAPSSIRIRRCHNWQHLHRPRSYPLDRLVVVVVNIAMPNVLHKHLGQPVHLPLPHALRYLFQPFFSGPTPTRRPMRIQNLLLSPLHRALRGCWILWWGCGIPKYLNSTKFYP